MGSIAAKEVAKKVVETLGKGEKPNLGEIIREVGYAENTSLTPQNVTETQSYKETIEPFVSRLEKHREKIIAAMEAKDLSKEQYRTLSESLAKLTHDVQLLSGGKTENIGLEEDRKTLQAVIATIRG